MSQRIDQISNTKWVIASNNKGKINEITNILSNLNITLLPQDTFEIPEAQETASTFVGNAILKAVNASKIANLPALADDSGLVVPCLNNEPGLYSARYAGTNNSTDNINKLISKIKQLHNIPVIIPAYFYCVVVFLESYNDPCPIIAQGRWNGQIVLEPRGDNGFGYDPVFYDPNLNLTAAEMTPEQKHSISHRGNALKELKNILLNT